MKTTSLLIPLQNSFLSNVMKTLRLNPNQIAGMIFLISIIVGCVLTFSVYSLGKKQDLMKTQIEANRVIGLLESSLNHSVTATKVIAFLIQSDLMGDYFNTVADDLLEQNSFIDAIQLVKGNEIIQTYPLEGNEASIGYRVMEITTHWRQALIALERNELYFEGPIELVQGGIGIVGRYPIYINDEYWGFSAVIIRMETLYEALGINEKGYDELFTYQFVKVQDGVEDQNYFFNNTTGYDSGIFYKAFVPIGNWNMYVKSNTATYWIITSIVGFLSLLLSVMLALYVRQLAHEPVRLQQLVDDKTLELSKTNRVLEQHAKGLSLSNKELEQFAYVASHDLQEPLRMISSFLTQLEKKYGNQLDEKAHKYIFFAVDGAKRMRSIILDLLAFSRLTEHIDKKEAFDVNEIVNEYCILRSRLIEEKEASVVSENLPVILSYKAPVMQIIHNLIDNALHYTREGVKPVVNISVKDKETYWEFSISDNGIGIEKEYFEKIFVIFQRLHDNKNYSGTGMGLAIVKKIILSLEGSIWVESELNQGSTFYFTLKKELQPL